MMMRILTCLCLALAAFAVFPAAAQNSMSIVAVVNEDAITEADLQDRMRLVIASLGMQDGQDIRARMAPQILNALVEERIKLQEAKRLDIIVGQEDIDAGFAEIAAQNGMDAAQFKQMLESRRIPARTMAQQIESQIAWTKVVQQELRPQVDVNGNDVAERLERLRANIGKTEYLVAEIFLPVDEPGQESAMRQLAQRLSSEIAGGKASFPAVAAQFSRAAGAENGGMIGWVMDGQLPQELDEQIKVMGEGEISGAVRSLTGFHILLVQKKRTLSEENLPSNSDLTNQIGMERLERVQQRHLSDLKAAAFIDRRV